MVAKQSGTFCGAPVAERVFRMVDPRCRVTSLAREGAAVKPGARLMKIRGGRAILTAERTALNFLQHMSGIATAASVCAAALGRGRTKIYDTRKTQPGLRALAKYAVRCGGGHNHRRGLWDACLIKDNHIAMLGPGAADKLAAMIKSIRARRPGVPVEIEAQDRAQALAFAALRPDILMLENMPRPMMKKLIPELRRVAPRMEIELSGGIKLKDLRGLAGLGADRISSGAITAAAGTLDISFQAGVVSRR
jgi:nicotinate-nucleotide pyrophosphorylase (carboxylating)